MHRNMKAPCKAYSKNVFLNKEMLFQSNSLKLEQPLNIAIEMIVNTKIRRNVVMQTYLLDFITNTKKN